MNESFVTVKSYRDEIEGKLTAKLEDAMNRVGVLVKERAAKNIKENQAKSPWRKTGQVASSVINQTVIENNKITAEIGIPQGETHKDSKTAVDKIGKWLELGTPNGRQPPYPWLFPAVESNRQNIINLLKG
jgi:hypothetical protein